ncbi:MAG: hypothetical protein LBH25_00270 [Fibromonadaceae bacterium]|jgi:hypothetical protein|nr:hypothetical protein [Fibromonadaceae bacterium]
MHKHRIAIIIASVFNILTLLLPSVYEKVLGMPIDLRALVADSIIIRDHNFLLNFFAFTIPIILTFLGNLKGQLTGVPKALAIVFGYINICFCMLIEFDLSIITTHYQYLGIINRGECNLISYAGSVVVMYHLYKVETLSEFIYIFPYSLMIFSFMPYILIVPIQITLLYSQAS